MIHSTGQEERNKMTYIPKNKIKTNLYTSGNQYSIEGTGEEYIGFYYSLYTGEKYTGKTPNDPPNERLIDVAEDAPSFLKYQDSNLPTTQVCTSNVDYGPFPNKSREGMLDRSQYNFLTETEMGATRLLPSPFYPFPIEDDYKLGVFTRYFCVKTNETQWVEVNKRDYTGILKKSFEYQYQLYQVVKLQWTLRGEVKYVETTNRNSVLIAENEIKRKGLRVFLKENYLKFYRSEQIISSPPPNPTDLSFTAQTPQPQQNNSQSSPITGSSFSSNPYG